MDIQTILLGFLNDKSMTGYELKNMFSLSFSFFSGISFGSIYPALKNMEKLGLITINLKIQKDAPTKKICTITKKGRKTFQEALKAPLPLEQHKSTFLSRLFFFSCLAQEERVKHGSFPTMTIYEVTEKGRNEFDKMQAEAFLGLYPLYIGFKLALKFNVRRTADDIAAYAAQAIELITLQLAGMDAYMDALPSDDPRSKSDAFFIEHDRMLLKEEKKWIQMAVQWSRDGKH